MEEAMRVLIEKLREAFAALVNLGGEALAPEETTVKEINNAQSYLITAAALVLLVMLFRCCCGGDGSDGPVRMMKAPGGNYRMPRATFEGDPKGYFGNLRARK
ncbi:hypothetical protein C2S53_011297 [Perilla frutescens var. hirtella]|uniref:Uncharacterized protein n=1 Tax=Perilla frutescens var. hirtella TaxID=608512 RepID=A0AAD4IX37_PERFH|nr:hypothetical protein C2S53_011297 [Perilla frutescens var. hirtella]